ncbi:hypothetical protein EC973_003161 [Apophysomyces ossiformis]|uniref:polynucleotide adenylyltransferase n=1 Tax=Apophysomyces ossiformis TaxID=679940 RepID=A0A8H7BFW6_9FUNG|nr:hypothetical protein EC973_003161 [Apophysomyces ossiformis]
MARTKKSKKQKLANQQAKETEDSIITNIEEDFIALDEEDKRSRQEKRFEIKSGNKRKREEEEEDEETSDFESFTEDEKYVYPWVERLQSVTLPKNPTVSAFFQKEIVAFVQYLEPSRAEVRMREFLIHRVEQVIKRLSPRSKVDDSDIDIVVNPPVGERLQLRKIARALEKYDICDNTTVIDRATVPVIKFEDALTELKVDIIVDSTTGLASAEIIKTMIRQQPGLRQLTLIIKHFLALRKLNEVFSGGLGGYAIVCLVLSFLQMHPKVASGEIDPEKNLGPLLIEFFHLYGINFELGRIGICVRNRGSYFDADYDNDIGCKSYSAVSVCQHFRKAYLTLTSHASALAEQVERQSKKGKDVRDCFSKTSLLKHIIHIPVNMISQRDLIEECYLQRRWLDEFAADSFSWTAEELGKSK